MSWTAELPKYHTSAEAALRLGILQDRLMKACERATPPHAVMVGRYLGFAADKLSEIRAWLVGLGELAPEKPITSRLDDGEAGKRADPVETSEVSVSY